jgi:hypothetical protein
MAINQSAIGLLLIALALAWLSVRAARKAAHAMNLPPALVSAGVGAIANRLA